MDIVVVKSTMAEMTSSREELAEERISCLEDRPVEIIQPPKRRVKRMEKS